MRRILRGSQRVHGVATPAAAPARAVRARSSMVAAGRLPIVRAIQFHGGRASSSAFDRDQISSVWCAAAVAASVSAALALTLDGDEHSTVQCLSTQHAEQRDRYSLSKELGRGGFSVVRLALDTKTNERLAAKIFDPKFCSMDDIKAEIAILKYLGKHRNIVGLHDVQSLQNETIMFTDLVEGGELFDYIVDMGSISERDASRLLHDVCTGLEYIHSLGVCHRDLKPENVLLTDHSSNADLKLADFGLSRRLRPDENVVEARPSGTVAYWAPEIIRRQPQGLAVDMWAFGVLAYITLTGVHPFDPRGDKSDAEIVTQIARGKYDMSNKWYRALSSDAKAFLAELLDPNPSTRLSAKQALAHPWLRGQTPAATPLPDGHAQRLLAYQRLQKLRANILTVIMGQQHAKFESKPHKPSDNATKATAVVVPAPMDTTTTMTTTTTTVNMDMFREAFTLFDKDESGDITRDELANVLNALGQQLHQSEVDAIMREADLDGDGKISFLEFVAMMNQRLFKRGGITEDDLRSAFNLFDSNGDGFINGQELQHIMHVLGNLTLTLAETSQIIAGVDANGDGKIDFHEFEQLMGAGGLGNCDQPEPRP